MVIATAALSTPASHTRARPAPRAAAHGVPGRTRMVAWTLAVTALGMLVLLLGASWALQSALDQRTTDSLAREAGEIRRFATLAVDPATGASFTSAERLMDVYLERQHPETTELLVAAVPGTSWRAERRGDRTATFDALDPAVRERVLSAGSGSTRTPGHGPISWHAVELDAGGTAGVIAVVRFLGPQRAAAYAQVGLLGGVALLALLTTGTAAWLLTGRLTTPLHQFEHAVAVATTGASLTLLPADGRPEYVRLARAGNRLVAGATAAYGRETQLHHDLAHHLQTPLATLRRSLEHERRVRPERAEALREGLAEVRRLQNLVADLVLLHRVELPGLIEPRPAVALPEFAAILVDLWQTRVVEMGATSVRVAIGPCDPAVCATLDEPRLARAVDELLANAVRASPVGAVVWLSVGGWHDARGSWAHIDITDTGRGIPGGERVLVLERFGTASNDPQPGSGLGLTVADRLVAAMGGTLTLIANEGAGTTARIVLPVLGATR